ncbi:hypothetical protein [Bordetella flabilis]|uniref:Uncharacterized protein n=1 Tax=Bordetella flabilis TaxID=463014 RepID=A0A193GI87_9BORD|nr:hypothetical protein [Bordetella flabilis]ANN79308.1 hypothetical protein BAU07_21225 [Bordetella flabilis]
MANTIMPPSGSAMGVDAPMRFVFTYVPPGPADPKDVPVVFTCTDSNVKFEPPQAAPVMTDPVTGELAVTVIYGALTENETVTIDVRPSPTGTPYISGTYTTAWVKTGKLVLSPKSVPVAPQPSDLGKPGYTATATVQFTWHGTPLKNYPVAFQMQANVHVYDSAGNELQPDANYNYYFYTGSTGQPATFKVSSEFEGVYTCSVRYGSQYSADNDHLSFMPELTGGPLPQFNLWSPLNLDDFPGPFVNATIVGDLDHTVPPTQPVIALVNRTAASDIVPYESLKTGVNIQKQKFSGQTEYYVNWMTTDTTSGITTQSQAVLATVTGDTWQHPPTDGELAKPYVLGIGIINIPLLLKGDITVFVPELTTGDKITLVYFLNGWAPGQNPPDAIANSYPVEYTATTTGTNAVMIPAGNLGGYAANNNERGTFECYYYKGWGSAGDKSTYSAPLSPIIPLVTA